MSKRNDNNNNNGDLRYPYIGVKTPYLAEQEWNTNTGQWENIYQYPGEPEMFNEEGQERIRHYPLELDEQIVTPMGNYHTPRQPMHPEARPYAVGDLDKVMLGTIMSPFAAMAAGETLLPWAAQGLDAAGTFIGNQFGKLASTNVGRALADQATKAGQSKLGQYLINNPVSKGIGTILSNPYIQRAGDLAGTYYGTKGFSDIMNGEATPESYFDLGLGLLPLYNAKNLSKTDELSEELGNIFSNKELHEVPKELREKITKQYSNFINSSDYSERLDRANLKDHWNYIKDLTSKRINNNNFPTQVKEIIDNDPKIKGKTYRKHSIDYRY